MKTFRTVLIFIMCLEYLDNLETSSVEYIFSHSTSNVKVHNKFYSAKFSHEFRVSLIALRLYSLINNQRALFIIGTISHLEKYNTTKPTIMENLEHFMINGACILLWGELQSNFVVVDVFRKGDGCESMLKFSKVNIGRDLNDLIYKGRNHVLVVWIMRAVGEHKNISIFEYAVLLVLKKYVRSSSHDIYKCTYINTFGHLRTFKFKIINKGFVGTDTFILSPFYYIR